MLVPKYIPHMLGNELFNKTHKFIQEYEIHT